MTYFAPLDVLIREYLSEDYQKKVHKAYLLAEKAHTGQKRASGEPYITHPVAVACILATMHLDPESLMAAILHDVIEDTPVDKKTLVEQFGQQVGDLVDGVSKLTQIKFESRAEAQAENFRKMVLAMAKDIRVIIVKLADRLHNMRTLEGLAASKRRRIALETLEIYAPIANRLGMHNFRVEFEDLGFAAMYPLRYRVLQNSVQKARGNRKEILTIIEKTLLEKLSKAGLTATQIFGREKHLYSIYKKMRNKGIPFSEIMDVYAFRIVVKNLDDCYRVLGLVHNTYKPVPERFKDYIAIPKANGYQSLHTILFGPYGVPIEIQIRTEEMNSMAESGIAAHWLYKSGEELGGNTAHLRAQAWLRNLVDMQQSAGSSIEFIENVKIDLFPEEVYVFTPKGRILELPKGSSAVDFAYMIHTDIGNTCVAAKINRRLAPLSTELSNGQTVEIMTSPGASPNPAWLNFVVTGKARSEIKQTLKKQRSSESMNLGKRLLERALSTLSLHIEDIPQKNIEQVLKESHYKTFDELLEATGLGHQIPLVLARRLAFAVKQEVDEEAREKQSATEELSRRPFLIKGIEGMVVSFAECCRPIPGDVIVGVLAAGRGIVVHRQQCSLVKKYHNTEKCIYLSWGEKVHGEFTVEILLDMVNRRGVLAELASAAARSGTNIEDIKVRDHDGRYSEVHLTVTVRDRVHLARTMRRMKAIDATSKITRITR